MPAARRKRPALRSRRVTSGPLCYWSTSEISPRQRRQHRTATTPAAYRKSDATLYVNAETFLAMSEDEQLAVIVHEVGHAVQPEADCFDADMFACQHGQEATLVAERAKHYAGAAGSEYAAALQQWRDPTTAREAFAIWRGKKLAGVI